MEKNKMTPEWVVQNFLPDYESRLTAYAEDRGITSDSSESRLSLIMIYDEFCKNHYPEGLAEMLKAQRVICQDIFDNRYKTKQIENVYYNRLMENAPPPNLKQVDTAKIIKHGELPHWVCRECGCEFTYTKDDIRVRYPFSAREEAVYCPECKARNVIAIEYW